MLSFHLNQNFRKTPLWTLCCRYQPDDGQMFPSLQVFNHSRIPIILVSWAQSPKLSREGEREESGWCFFLWVTDGWVMCCCLTNHLLSPGFSCAVFKKYSFTREKQLWHYDFWKSWQSYFSTCKEGIGLETGLATKVPKSEDSTPLGVHSQEVWTMVLSKLAFVNELLVLIFPKMRRNGSQ